MPDSHGRFFEKWSRFYESTPVFSRLLNAQQDEAIRRLDAKPGERVLDLGCGTGRALQKLTQAIGADASLPMLREAPHKVAAAKAGELPFRNGAFDAILCTNSYHHYPEPLATLKEMRRVLKARGRLILVDPNQDSKLSRATIYGGEALLFGMTVHLHTPQEWLSLCTQAGFRNADAGTLHFGVSICVEARA
jgi:ubiquinone/menaquinone biosynthesis C-methylase UbiE